VGRLGSELLLTRVSLLVMFAGLIVALWGWQWLRALAFPLAFLGFMIPWPTLIYNLATVPLKAIATRTGVSMVAWTRLPILREGNLIILPGAVLDVVAACSGIRSLLALLALATGYGYLLEPVAWRRVVLVAAMPPLAVVSNAIRIALTILLTFRFGPGASEGVWHMLTGMQVFIVAVLGLVLLQRGLPGWRYWTLAALLLAAAWGMRAYLRQAPQLALHSLDDFPLSLGPWQGSSTPLPPATLAALDLHDYLNRVYFGPDQQVVGLYIAYYPKQTFGDDIHSP